MVAERAGPPPSRGLLNDPRLEPPPPPHEPEALTAPAPPDCLGALGSCGPTELNRSAESLSEARSAEAETAL